jgi:D-3-phosphoglycerate dehydrogenase
MPFSNKKGLKVYRPHVSPYQDPHFKTWEKKALEKIEGITYLDSLTDSPQILLTNTHFDYQSFLNQNGPSRLNALELIIHPNSGYDNFPRALIQKISSPIILGNPIRSQAVSNYILSCIFEQFTAIPLLEKWNPLRTWSRETLQEKNILIIGHGHIGSILKVALGPLVKEICMVDPYKGLTSLEESPLEKAHIVILACGLNQDNQGLLGKKQFSRMKTNVLLINPARGKLISEKDLIDFLGKHPDSFAYLDVFEKEPVDYKKFQNLNNIRLTPHIAGVFDDLDLKIIEFESEILQNYLKYKNKTFNFFNHYNDLVLKNKLWDGIVI